MSIRKKLLELHTNWSDLAHRSASSSLSMPDRAANAYLSCVSDIEHVLDEYFPGWSCECCGKILTDAEIEACVDINVCAECDDEVRKEIKKNHKCHENWLWETIAGVMRVSREVDGKTVHRVRCGVCGYETHVDSKGKEQ